ncbi:hypothetical protein [Candidatus Pelagibacter sp.]|uniref:hypothetical protein n=1 Tax=Candidatus Pelagibacter sp. TaxID=2024849 RepID=UPI003F866F27
MTSTNTLKVKKWYQKKKQDPKFHEEYKKKQRLYYYKRKYNLTEIPKKELTKRVIIDYGSVNCKYCNKEFKKLRHIHYFCSRSCLDKHHESIRKPRRRRENLTAPRNKIKKNPEQLKMARKRSKIKYWKKLKDEDPKKYELMLEKTRQATRKWKEKNKDKLKSSKYLQTQRRWKKQKIKTDPIYKISERLRSYLSRSIKGVIQKNSKTEKIVGTSFKNLVSHLEKQFKPGMTLSNYGKWHIDHIKPITKYDLTKPGEVEKCFHYTNLQPLWAAENIKKSNKY